MWCCRRVRKQLALYVGGELTPAELEAVEAHLERCRACRQELRRLRSARDQLLKLAACDTGSRWPSVLPDVAAQIRHLPPPSSSRRWLWILPYLAVAATTLAALAGWMTLRRPVGGDLAVEQQETGPEEPSETLLFTTSQVERAAPAPHPNLSVDHPSYHLDWASPRPVYSGSFVDN